MFGCLQIDFFQMLYRDRHHEVLHFETWFRGLDLHSVSSEHEKMKGSALIIWQNFQTIWIRFSVLLRVAVWEISSLFSFVWPLFSRVNLTAYFTWKKAKMHWHACECLRRNFFYIWLAHSCKQTQQFGNNDNNNNEHISRVLFHVKHAQLRWTGANTKIENACV